MNPIKVLYEVKMSEILKSKQLDADSRLALWHSRPWQHRALHRWNVLAAYVQGLISIRNLWNGLRHAHEVVMLPLRSPRRGMIFVCPAAVREYEEMCGANGPGATAKSVALEPLEQPSAGGEKVQTVDSSVRSP